MTTSKALEVIIQDCIDTVVDTYCRLSIGQWNELRQYLLRFFHGKRVRVSNFLQKSIQNPDGSFSLPDIRSRPRFEQEAIGHVFISTGVEKDVANHPFHAFKVELEDFKLDDEKAPSKGEGDDMKAKEKSSAKPSTLFDPHFSQGLNIYGLRPSSPCSSLPSILQTASTLLLRRSKRRKLSSRNVTNSLEATAETAALNRLASLMNCFPSSPTSTKEADLDLDVFTLNLFPHSSLSDMCLEPEPSSVCDDDETAQPKFARIPTARRVSLSDPFFDDAASKTKGDRRPSEDELTSLLDSTLK